MATELVLLGTAGYIPHGSRETCCALLRRDDAAVLIDAGSGVRRLVEQPDLLAGVRRLDVLLTHFHLDHTIGLSFVPALRLERLPEIHGPGAALYGTPTDAILRRVFSRPQSAFGLEVVGRAAEVRIPEHRIGPFTFRLRRQPLHTDATIGIRLDDAFALCTDTEADPETPGFARGVRTLLHDMWALADDIDRIPGMHTSAADAARDLPGDAGGPRPRHDPRLAPPYRPSVLAARAGGTCRPRRLAPHPQAA